MGNTDQENIIRKIRGETSRSEERIDRNAQERQMNNVQRRNSESDEAYGQEQCELPSSSQNFQ